MSLPSPIALFMRVWRGRVCIEFDYGYGMLGPLPILAIRKFKISIKDGANE